MHSPRTARDRLDRILSILKRTPRFYAPALILFVVGAAAAVTYAMSHPRLYKSETLILYREGIRSAPSGGGYDEGADRARKLGLRLKEMVLSRTRLQQIIDEFKLYPTLVEERGYVDAVDEMRNHIAFRVRDGDTFGLSFEGDDPRRVQAVTVRLAEALIAENSRTRAEQAEVTKDFLDGEKRRNEREMRDRETTLAQFLAKHPEFALEMSPTNPNQAGSMVRAAQSKSGRTTDPALLALEREAGRLKQRLVLAGEHQRPEEPRGDPALVAAKTEAETALRSAHRELADKQAQFTEEHPDVLAAKVRVGAAEQKLKRAADALSSSIAAERQKVAAKSGELLVDRVALEGELRKINSEITAYRARREYGGGAAAQASRVVALETEWARLNREVAEAREQRQQLEDKEFKAAMAESAATSGRSAQMVIVDPAFRPTHPAKPGRTLIAATGMLISLLLAFSLALGCALLDDRVYDRTDLERLELGAPTALVPTPGLSKARPGERGARSQLAGAALAPVEVSLSAAAQAAGPGDATDRGPNSGLPRVIVEALPTSPMGITRPDNPGTPDVRGPTARITLPFVKLNDPGAKTHILNPREASRPSSGRGGEKVAVQGGSGVAAAADSTVLLDSPAEVEPLPQIWVAKPTGKPAAVVDPRLILMAAPESVSAASFRVLRHRLEERGKLRILAVTSAESGEGKTTLAANLALALGEYGRARVLLVEANLRAPALAALFGFAPPEGFVAQLERHKRSPLEPWWVVEVERSLHVLAAHPKSDGEGRSLLDAPAFGLAIEAISRAGYDYIVFDTPPVLGSADVNLVQDWADGVLLSAWARRTSGRAIRRALEQLAPAKLVGLALLGA